MHPFFKNAASRHTPDPKSDANDVGGRLNGQGDPIAVEAENHASIPAAFQSSGLQGDDRKAPSGPPAPHRAGLTSCTEHDGHDRVKRRRISLDDSPLRQAPIGSCGQVEQQTCHQQLDAAAMRWTNENQNHDGQQDAFTMQTHPPITVHSPIAPVSSETTVIPTISPDGGGCDSNATIPATPTNTAVVVQADLAHAEQTVTPKKTRNTRPASDSNLSPAPAKSPRRSPRSASKKNSTSNPPRKVARTSKKVEMKNGRFVPSLRLSLPYHSADCGTNIDKILAGQATGPDPANLPIRMPVPTMLHTSTSAVAPGEKKTTHPFFTGSLGVKAQPKPPLSRESSSLARTSDDETQTSPQAPKSRKEIVFSSQKASIRSVGGLEPIWPPRSIQFVQPDIFNPGSIGSHGFRAQSSKAKHRLARIDPNEDLMVLFTENLKHVRQSSPLLHVPQRLVIRGHELLDRVQAELDNGDASLALPPALKSRIVFSSTSFDKGMAGGPLMWPQEYAPSRLDEVFQPQCRVLYDWLSNLQVHQVQNGNLQAKPKLMAPKKRRKRRLDDLDDFIADSDEDSVNLSTTKNAILITGPSGCGKTASVFAVARQLGFEVFEIHPGMRRGAKDIQDKVGDMTQNHLVHQAENASRRSSISTNDADPHSPSPQPMPASQRSMANFMKSRPSVKPARSFQGKGSSDAKAKAQKQSLILFEEVDILFDDDKGFWSGVQSLIRTSKRPVILTCNSLETVPLDELDLFTILTFERPAKEQVVNYLGAVAAAEGHLLRKDALLNLYLSKGQDLRASLTELNFWCQMTVGSRQGGLDWMLPSNDRRASATNDSVVRIVSQDTFVKGLDLLPLEVDSADAAIQFCLECLDVPPVDWATDGSSPPDTGSGNLAALDEMWRLADAKSAMDCVDAPSACPIASSIRQWTPSSSATRPSRDVVSHLYLDQLSPKQLPRASLLDAVGPLMEESRIGLPTSLGRKAPSLDGGVQSLITEVLPYIRCIVAHDRRLEYLRNELAGGLEARPKRQRKTRAARAALEGGNKGSTRRDKWFTEHLDFATVLATGHDWPQLQSEDVSSATTPSPSPSMQIDIETTGAL